LDRDHKKSSKINAQEDMGEDIYGIKGRMEAVIKRINARNQISKRNRQLIFDFCDY